MDANLAFTLGVGFIAGVLAAVGAAWVWLRQTPRGGHVPPSTHTAVRLGVVHEGGPYGINGEVYYSASTIQRVLRECAEQRAAKGGE